MVHKSGVAMELKIIAYFPLPIAHLPTAHCPLPTPTAYCPLPTPTAYSYCLLHPASLPEQPLLGVGFSIEGLAQKSAVRSDENAEVVEFLMTTVAIDKGDPDASESHFE